MPDLGKYALEVTLAYAGSLSLLVGFVALSFAQARRMRARLNALEAEQENR